MPECRLAVLGRCCADMQRGASGVGKSSLCARFVHPDKDRWAELGRDHSHWMSQADIQEPEINGDHFLYFGVGRRDHYPMRHEGLGRRESGTGLSVHVVEHTAFLNDSTAVPFPGAENYAERATRSLIPSKHPGKVAYSCRSRLGEDGPTSSLMRKQYPVEFAKPGPGRKELGVQGYLFVMDPTADTDCLLKQWKLWEECWSRIPSATKKKDSCAIVLTKCASMVNPYDILNKKFNIVKHFLGSSPQKTSFRGDSEKLAVRSGKYSVPVFFTSAEERIGVDLPFIFIAHRALGLPGRPIGPVNWEVAVEMRRKLNKVSLAAAVTFLNENVTSAEQTWNESSDLLCHTPMDMCRSNHGEAECKALFKSRLITIIADQADRSVAAVPNPNRQMRKQAKDRMFEMIGNHPDLKELMAGSDGASRADTQQFNARIKRLRKSVSRSVGSPRRARKERKLAKDEETVALASQATSGEEQEEDENDCEVVMDWFSEVNSSAGGKKVPYEEWVLALKSADQRMQQVIDDLHEGNHSTPTCSPAMTQLNHALREPEPIPANACFSQQSPLISRSPASLPATMTSATMEPEPAPMRPYSNFPNIHSPDLVEGDISWLSESPRENFLPLPLPPSNQQEEAQDSCQPYVVQPCSQVGPSPFSVGVANRDYTTTSSSHSDNNKQRDSCQPYVVRPCSQVGPSPFSVGVANCDYTTTPSSHSDNNKQRDSCQPYVVQPCSQVGPSPVSVGMETPSSLSDDGEQDPTYPYVVHPCPQFGLTPVSMGMATLRQMSAGSPPENNVLAEAAKQENSVRPPMPIPQNHDQEDYLVPDESADKTDGTNPTESDEDLDPSPYAVSPADVGVRSSPPSHPSEIAALYAKRPLPAPPVGSLDSKTRTKTSPGLSTSPQLSPRPTASPRPKYITKPVSVGADSPVAAPRLPPPTASPRKIRHRA